MLKQGFICACAKKKDNSDIFEIPFPLKHG